MEGSKDQNWMPLESNSEVINEFIAKMGLKTQKYSFYEMLSTEEWALEMIQKPVYGVLFLFQLSPVQVNFRDQQKELLKPEEIPNELFFMKQMAKNACGTIGLFHIIINAFKWNPDMLVPDSYLAKFANQSQTKSPEESGEMFKASKELLKEHKSASCQGQSEVQAKVDSHFISFVPFGGHIYELDGFKKCPVDHGECSQDNFLSKASASIRQFMERDPDNISFSMIVLTKVPETE